MRAMHCDNELGGMIEAMSFSVSELHVAPVAVTGAVMLNDRRCTRLLRCGDGAGRTTAGTLGVVHSMWLAVVMVEAEKLQKWDLAVLVILWLVKYYERCEK